MASPGALAGTALGAVLSAATGRDNGSGTPIAPGGRGGDLTSGAQEPFAPDPGALALLRARAFAEPLLAGRQLDSGEDALGHADGVAAILAAIGAAPAMRAEIGRAHV